jgi:cytochrome c553
MKNIMGRDREMKTIIGTVVIAAMLIGCGESSSSKEIAKEKEADSSQIKVTQGEKRIAKAESRHSKELDKDKKGFYYTYNDKKKEEHSEDKTFTRVDAQKRVKNKVVDGKVAVREKNHEAATPYQYVRIDLLKSALSHDFMVKCSACHDDYANGIIGPSLLDKDASYIFEKIMQYKVDPTKNILMYELVSQMDEESIQKIADEVAEFNKEIRALKEKR